MNYSPNYAPDSVQVVRNRHRINDLLTEYRLTKMQVKQEKKALTEAEALIANTVEAQALVQQVAKEVQTRVHKQIASVVTHCLKSVFVDDAYEFKIDFRRARGKTEAVLQFVRGGMVIDDPLDECGGGVIDVAAFALRLACLTLSVPSRRKLLVMDEPFRFLSAEYIPAVRELLLTLAKDVGIQMILVTHNRGLECGEVVEIE